jgi:AAA ATPase domain
VTSIQPPRLGDKLTSQRRQRFVGRAAEIELFRDCLDAESPTFAVLYVHGPGGIGKSSLLDAFAVEAHRARMRVVRLDARDLLPSPDGVRRGIDRARRDSIGRSRDESQRTVVLLDSYERLEALDDWIREQLLPDLPADAVTVLAGRLPPGSGWRADAAWRDLLRVIALRNLSPDEARAYLRRCGLAEAVHETLLTASYGHPLGLSLLADQVVRHGSLDAVRDSPDLVTTLVRRFLDTVPDASQREALEACALARVTTESLLRAALDSADVRETFDWLRDLSFVEAGPNGLFPHDLARDVIDRDLRWRDPDSYQLVFRRVQAHLHRQLLTSDPDQRVQGIFDVKFVFRNLPSVVSPVDWQTWGSHLPAPARPEDHAEILDLVRLHEGDDSASVAHHWLTRQPHAFVVLRHPSGSVRGFLALIDLSEASDEDRAADPGAAAAWDRVQREGGIRAGQRVNLTRFVIDAESYQDPSPTLNTAPVVTLQLYLSAPDLAWDFLALARPDRWNDYFAMADMGRVPGADFAVGGRRYGLFGHDFRALPLGPWMDLWAERALAQDPQVTPRRSVALLVLSQPDFGDAVRQGLKDLARPDLLARNPLLRTRLLADAAAGGPADAATLDRVLRAAVATLTQDPRDDKQYRAVEQTYLRRTATQEGAAARLGLPFSTYRRHLGQGVARIVAWCWEREVYGPSQPMSPPEHH